MDADQVELMYQQVLPGNRPEPDSFPYFHFL